MKPMHWLILIGVSVFLVCRFFIPMSVYVAFFFGIFFDLEAGTAMRIGFVVAAGLLGWAIYRGLRG